MKFSINDGALNKMLTEKPNQQEQYLTINYFRFDDNKLNFRT